MYKRSIGPHATWYPRKIAFKRTEKCEYSFTERHRIKYKLEITRSALDIMSPTATCKYFFIWPHHHSHQTACLLRRTVPFTKIQRCP